MRYLLQWRNCTPSGKPSKVEWRDHMTQEDVTAYLPKLWGKTCWIYIAREDVDFKGKAAHRG